MNFVIFINCALLALISMTSPALSGEDDYDPCKAAAFINGDIAITKYELLRLKRTRRAATSLQSRRWIHGIIPYEIDNVFRADQKAVMLKAMRHWENKSCLTFVEHTTEKDYIFIEKGHCGCCSFVGRKGMGKQGVSIGRDCDNFGVVVHELGHVVGFWHEHTRPDRDKYVKIVEKNILEDKKKNYAILGENEVDSLGEKYDFGSIMHYSLNLFSKSSSNVIIPKVNISKSLLANIGQRRQLSEGDVVQVNKMYHCPKCGGTLQKAKGTIYSPGYPFIDLKPYTCEWRVSTNPGEVIELTIKEFDLRSSRNCENDYVEIRDGYGPNSTLIGKYCGSNRPPMKIRSTGNRLLVKMIKKRISQGLPGKGFLFSYKAACGGVMKLDKGEIQSPNYPSSYKYNKKCNWKVIVKEGTRVGITFGSFEVEEATGCSFDALSIYDGLDESKLLTRLCGNILPKDMNTSSNTALIRFESDNSVDSGGFVLNFFSEVDECEENNGGCEHNCRNTIGSYECYCMEGYELHSDAKNCEPKCGGELKDSNGTITSPSYPDSYPDNKKCIWSIRAPPLHQIKLSFKEFELEESEGGCEYDYLVVKNKKNTTRLCGDKNPGVMVSTTNEMDIEFVSDNSRSKKGFEAEYYTDKDECQEQNGGCQHDCLNFIGGYMCTCRSGFILHEDKLQCVEVHKDGKNPVLDSSTGTIMSPNYPNFYNSSLNIRWNIVVTPGHRVKLTFKAFSLEKDRKCEYDYVLVDTGYEERENRLCGTITREERKVQISRLNKMEIHFQTDKTHVEKGFKAVYETVCGGRLHADKGEQLIYSHADYNLNKPYPANASCKWHLAAKKGYVIEIKLETFELEDNGCLFDFLRVTDGSDETAPEIARLCGTQTGRKIQSTGNNMWLEFQTNGREEKRGFLIDYVRLKL
ncbi:dorsal-ventral patterning tolloid-like protein 1 [Dendronephthya gigantea]|uniref:dorsal-ventral patterning tolloid-like protein 1 n=1 Tax=Dendronephthya gigantea TaxID=151771 RepID=UPI00106B646E|nr:dorsal-ventral patterning tolloid-like protein 1 [Dendronephthya gigantea]